MSAPVNITQYIQSHEGLRLAAYDDATGEPVPVGGACKGTLTIGWGHTGPEVVPGLVWTLAQCLAAFVADLAVAQHQAPGVIGADVWPSLGDARQWALTDMCFELGAAGLAKFHHMIAAIRVGAWRTAQNECLLSTLPRARAGANAALLLSGELPA